MDKKLKAKWVKALMSGKYKQATGCLHTGFGHCCLGVLEIVGEIKNNDYLSYLPAKSCGLPLSIQKQLAILNDSRIPFPVIAGFIQENL